ncbi:hypothetical protein LSUE1_G005473 [Lachnellula suecica]|uniref:Siroheme synthase n=1 Tax=Lachnellula suecica TaxID=602035 RepID=A0A8T9CG05_9HELO|nr:hypothetical protein LSUE1_G005473 [Lachnellula suecica]
MAPASSSPKPYPLYETSFTLQRLSPLYTGSESPFDNATLQIYAKQLRDVLAGDILRGVRVGMPELEDNVIARVGALQTVTWKLLPEEDLWATDDETQITRNDDTTMSLASARGVLVTITYEKASYTAILLRDMQADQDESMIGVGLDGFGFESFPLLLTKMPATLREPFANFLATTFDARVSVIQLPSAYLTTSFEQYLAYICVGEDGDPLDSVESSRALRTMVGSVDISVGFDLPGGSAALKTIDIQIAREDIPRMISRGKKARHGTEIPFTDALTAYVSAHLALSLTHEMVCIKSIACEAFVLGSRGVAKFSMPQVGYEGDSPQRRATRRLINRLITFAKGGAMAAGEWP